MPETPGPGLFGGPASALTPLSPSLVGQSGMTAAALLWAGYEDRLTPEYLLPLVAPAFTDDDPQTFRDALEVVGIEPETFANLIGSLVYFGVAFARRWASVDPTVDVANELHQLAMRAVNLPDEADDGR